LQRTKILISFNLADQHIQKIKETGLDLEIVKSKDKKECQKLIEDVDVLFAGVFTREMLFAAQQLKWVHYFGAGVDSILFPEFVESPIILTSSSGVHSIPVSEHVLGLMLSFTRGLHVSIVNQIKKKWEKVPVSELYGKTVGIVGLGNIGSEVARKVKCFGTNVIAVKKNLVEKPNYVDELLPVKDLKELFAKSDFVVLTLPLTTETRGLIGESHLKSMKKTAYLINVSRGEIIQEKALVKALKEGWFAGAGLDVFKNEPLPSNSELWNMKNVIITPHMAGSTPYYWERTTAIFCENLRRFTRKEKMINMINKSEGY
jgi:phosphoglycerate dehydrogenase-like enzyme